MIPELSGDVSLNKPAENLVELQRIQKSQNPTHDLTEEMLHHLEQEARILVGPCSFQHLWVA